LLISGVAYYLVPRFAGRPLRWPRLANLQLAMLGAGIAVGAAALAFRGYGHANTTIVIAAQFCVSAGFAALGAIIAGTFYARRTKSPATVTAVPLVRRPNVAPLPIRPSR
jgi:hypothetical protein